MDVFIVDYHHPTKIVINTSDSITKFEWATNDFKKHNGQSLLPNKFIYRLHYNIRLGCNERRCLPIHNDNKPICRGLIELNLDLENTIFDCYLLDVVTKLAEKRLTKKQKLVLKKISCIESKMTMSFLAERLSNELKIGKTTARLILQTLRDVGLISYGSSENKGQAVKLTKVGKIVTNKLNIGENKMLEVIK